MYYNTQYQVNSKCQMKQFKIKKFVAEAKKLKVTDKILLKTLSHFLKIDLKGRQKNALGAGLYKLRLATNESRGKSGGSRTILALKEEKRVIWLHLFAKNEKENITASELKKLKTLADILSTISDKDITRLIKNHELCEVNENV